MFEFGSENPKEKLLDYGNVMWYFGPRYGGLSQKFV